MQYFTSSTLAAKDYWEYSHLEGCSAWGGDGQSSTGEWCLLGIPILPPRLCSPNSATRLALGTSVHHNTQLSHKEIQLHNLHGCEK